MFAVEERIRALTPDEQERVRRERDAFGPAPVDPRDGLAWRAREVDVRARSVVTANGEDGDDTTYLLFEIPGADWFFLDVCDLPDGKHTLEEVAREHLKLTFLHPNGPLLSVEPSGPAIDIYETDEGQWSPDPDLEGMIPEEKLPAWIREQAV